MSVMRNISIYLAVLWAVVSVLPARSVTPRSVNVDWARAESMTADSLEKYVKGRRFYATWVEGTSCFYYNVTGSDGKAHYYIVDASTGRRRDMIKDIDRFVADYARFTGDTLDAASPALYGITFSPGDVRRFTIAKKGKTLQYDIASGRLREVKPVKAAPGKRVTTGFGRDVHNPDSSITMLGCGYDLYFRDNSTGRVTRLTDDGREDAAHTYRFKPDTTESNVSGFWAGNRFIQNIYDNSGIKEMGFVESLGEGRPRINTFKMPMPGDDGIRRFRIYWFNPETGEGRYLPIDKYPDQTVDLNYHRSAESLYFTRRSRRGDRIDLCRINVPDGTVTELISERCEPHMNLTLFNYKLLNGGQEIIWWSERTGRGNYYLYDSEGRLKNRITVGDSLVAGDIVRLDTIGRTMVYAGYGNEPGGNPYLRHYYQASLDGGKQLSLTPAEGHHELSLSSDGRYGIDKYSLTDIAPRLRAFELLHPERGHVIDSMDISGLIAAGWKAPKQFKVKAADGVTDLYGIMYLPGNFDPSLKYPVISNVYPGPQDDQVVREFAIDDNGNQSLAELGFVVICASSRGSSPLRGRDFYTYGYGNLRDYPLADDRHTIEELACRYPFIDLDRVGIYGHSGGAFQTVAAMLTYPDFYKVAVAASGNHDNNIYIQWWAEAFHGIDEITDSVTGKTTFSCKAPTNMELAASLKGRLLLVTGDVDKNVPPSCTYRMADALIRQGKRFDMFILPGKDHGVMCPYYLNLIRYYFVDNLLDYKPGHTDIVNHN